jgi:hypothetical protein
MTTVMLSPLARVRASAPSRLAHIDGSFTCEATRVGVELKGVGGELKGVIGSSVEIIEALAERCAGREDP